MPETNPRPAPGAHTGAALKLPLRQHEDPAQTAAERVADGSIEFSLGKEQDIEQAADLLPYRTPVFVPVLPRHDMASRLPFIARLKQHGFDPVPHIAARRMPSREALNEFLTAASGDAGVHRVLLIGGDTKSPVGPYADSAAVLRDGVLSANGIREVALAGYPEGHAAISPQDLRASLRERLDLLTEQGLGAQVVTQFSFVSSRIVDYCAQLASFAPEVPVLVGLAGPANLRQLVHYARYCGVSASLSALGQVGVKLAQLAGQGRADEQLAQVAAFCSAHDGANVTGVHLFSFGGFLPTAGWMNEHLNAPMPGG
jgi:methylenetetrahydrofolate reductase (NADPH)